MKTKTIIISNIIIILAFFILTTTITLSPGGETFERRPTFEWLGMPTGYTIMIDDNPDFSTPWTEKVEGKTYTPDKDLELGDYYWKVKGFRESNVQKFTIISKVSIKREEDEKLRNDGNARLKLDMQPGITGAVTLGINQTIKLEENVEEVIAEQDE